LNNGKPCLWARLRLPGRQFKLRGCSLTTRRLPRAEALTRLLRSHGHRDRGHTVRRDISHAGALPGPGRRLRVDSDLLLACLCRVARPQPSPIWRLSPGPCKVIEGSFKFSLSEPQSRLPSESLTFGFSGSPGCPRAVGYLVSRVLLIVISPVLLATWSVALLATW
jgi:hypothetical protein